MYTSDGHLGDLIRYRQRVSGGYRARIGRLLILQERIKREYNKPIYCVYCRGTYHYRHITHYKISRINSRVRSVAPSTAAQAILEENATTVESKQWVPLANRTPFCVFEENHSREEQAELLYLECWYLLLPTKHASKDEARVAERTRYSGSRYLETSTRTISTGDGHTDKKPRPV